MAWAAKDAFNPGAVVHEGRVHMLFRGKTRVGRFAGTSRIGLAVSDDGLTFEVHPQPVLFPDDDPWQAWEWPGGCEDPRVVESPDGGFVATYTAFDGKVGTLFVATSDDLRHWTKYGPAFASTPYALRSSKSGSIVTEVSGGRLWRHARTADSGCTGAKERASPPRPRISSDGHRSTSMPHGTATSHTTRRPTGPGTSTQYRGNACSRPILVPRRRRFDSLLVEPGPPAVSTTDGIVLIYNGANHYVDGDPSLEPLSYQPGQTLFDPEDPASCIARDIKPFLRADDVDAREGQVSNVCFAQALVLFEDRWHLYFGMADSRIGCAVAPAIRADR